MNTNESANVDGPTLRCSVCGRPISRRDIGVLALSATSRCPACERGA